MKYFEKERRTVEKKKVLECEKKNTFLNYLKN